MDKILIFAIDIFLQFNVKNSSKSLSFFPSISSIYHKIYLHKAHNQFYSYFLQKQFL